MDLTVYNPQKGRLETLSVELTADNTTWFDDFETADDIAMISDWDGDLLITIHGRDYPLRIHGASRCLVNYDPLQAKALQRRVVVKSSVWGQLTSLSDPEPVHHP